MPSLQHELLVEVFRNRRELVCELLDLVARIRVEPASIEAAPNDTSQLAPIEFRADRVFVLRDAAGAAMLTAIVEIQLTRDPAKRWSWPVYVAVARAEHACSAYLVVIVPDRGTASWARSPIELGNPGHVLTPIVVCLEELPYLDDVPVHQRSPELALLCTLGHPELDEAKQTLGMIAALDEERARVYLDGLLDNLPDLIRQHLEAHMNDGKYYSGKYEYRSEFARKYYGQGLEKGLEQGLEQGVETGRREALRKLLFSKFGALAPEHAAQIDAASSEQLERYLDRLLVADSIAAVLSD